MGLTERTGIDYRVCLAPMVSYTTTHYRYLARLMSPHVHLYTEMVVSDALNHNPSGRYLDRHPAEQPVALQLAGSEPASLALAAQKGEAAGFDEINLNVGCPSPKVKKGGFGACLMTQPTVVASAIQAMQAAVSVPVTAKIRLGVDDMDQYDHVLSFVQCVAEAGCSVFIVHARKAWLSGLNTKQNREVPPLRYEWVYRLKQECPELTIVINGGIQTAEEAQQHLSYVDGVMLGRAVLNHLELLSDLEAVVFGATPCLLDSVFPSYVSYMEEQLCAGTPWRPLLHPLVTLLQGCAGAKTWRRELNALGFLPTGVTSGLDRLSQAFDVCWAQRSDQEVMQKTVV